MGRKSDHDNVDVDLLLEGPAHKVSRRQGTIKLRSNGDFFITNEGKRPLFIDGVPLLHGNKTKLNNNCTIEVSVFVLCLLQYNFPIKTMNYNDYYCCCVVFSLFVSDCRPSSCFHDKC